MNNAAALCRAQEYYAVVSGSSEMFVFLCGFVVLLGSFLMPVLTRAARHFAPLLAILVIRALRVIVDKIIEAIIIAIATLAGFLHYLQILPGFGQ